MKRVDKTKGFTLIELMAAMCVIVALVAIALGVSGYVQRKVTLMRAKAEIAAMQAALDAYKGDFGYFPATTPVRLSALGLAESTNNWYLYRALCVTGRRYLGKTARVRVYVRTGLTNIIDPYDKPYNYYNSPMTPYSLYGSNIQNLLTTNTGYTVGGQVNVGTYDLVSYGPNGITFADMNADITIPGPPWPGGWNLPAAASDDITGW